MNSQRSLLLGKFTKIPFLLKIVKNISVKAGEISFLAGSIFVSHLSKTIICSYDTPVSKENKDRILAFGFYIVPILRASSLREALCGSRTLLDPGRFFHRCCRSSPHLPCASDGHGCHGRRGMQKIYHSTCIWRASPLSAAWYACEGCWRQWTSAENRQQKKK